MKCTTTFGGVAIRVGHLVGQFCPLISVFRYHLIATPHAQGAVFCNQRINRDVFPYPRVVEQRLSQIVERRVCRRISVKAGKKLGRVVSGWQWRTFLRRYRPDVLHTQFGDEALGFLPLVNRTSLPLVVTFWGSDINMATYRSGYLAELRRLFDRASICHFVSQALRHRAVSYGCPPEKATTVYVGSPIPESGVVYSSRTTDVRFSCVARLVPGKGHETLLRAFKQVTARAPGAALHLFGNGPLRDRLSWVVRELDLEAHVTFHGSVCHDAVQRHMREQTDVLVLTSRTDDQGRGEGLPVSLTEGAALGLPLIGTRCGGIPEVVRNDDTGLLVDQRDEKGLCDAMLHLARTPSLRQQMGNASRRLAIDLFDLQKQLGRIAQLYGQAQESHASAGTASVLEAGAVG